MKIIVLGTRGIPDILGGVETHCEELYPLLVKDWGHDITVITRSCYITNTAQGVFNGIKLKKIYAPKNKTFEAIIHSVLSILYAGLKRPDIVHIHAIGPCLVVPLARLLGLKVVMTHHGADYKRKKWGRMAKFFLRVGEWAGVKFANKVIVISEEISNDIQKKYGRNDAVLIPNGVSIKGRPEHRKEVLDKYGLSKGHYIFSLGRFVPEKGFDYLINSFINSGISNSYKLVIAGDADHESEYSLALKKHAELSHVILPGFVKGEVLAQLFSNCALFILPSFYEGLPIALLEGMAYSLPILASDIAANTQVGLPEKCYFPVGDENYLANKIADLLNNETSEFYEYYDIDNYNWNRIAMLTDAVYLEFYSLKD